MKTFPASIVAGQALTVRVRDTNYVGFLVSSGPTVTLENFRGARRTTFDLADVTAIAEQIETGSDGTVTIVTRSLIAERRAASEIEANRYREAGLASADLDHPAGPDAEDE